MRDLICDLHHKTSRLTARRFPPPCSVDEQPACFVVRDANGQQVAYVYFEDEPRRRSAGKIAHARLGAEISLINS